MTQAGRPTADWEPVNIVIEDATGNRRDDWQLIIFDDEERQTGRILPGLFSPHETWKLRIALARKEGTEFKPEELWTVAGESTRARWT